MPRLDGVAVPWTMDGGCLEVICLYIFMVIRYDIIIIIILLLLLLLIFLIIISSIIIIIIIFFL